MMHILHFDKRIQDRAGYPEWAITSSNACAKKVFMADRAWRVENNSAKCIKNRMGLPSDVQPMSPEDIAIALLTYEDIT